MGFNSGFKGLMYMVWIQTWRGGRSPNIFLAPCQVSLLSG